MVLLVDWFPQKKKHSISMMFSFIMFYLQRWDYVYYKVVSPVKCVLVQFHSMNSIYLLQCSPPSYKLVYKPHEYSSDTTIVMGVMSLMFTNQSQFRGHGGPTLYILFVFVFLIYIYIDIHIYIYIVAVLYTHILSTLNRRFPIDSLMSWSIRGSNACLPSDGWICSPWWPGPGLCR